MKPAQVQKRYFKELLLAFGLYTITLIASVSLLNWFDPPKWANILIALTPILPTILVFVTILRLVRDSDEFLQKVHFQAVIFSAVLTALLTFSYGFLEGIGFPKMPTMLVLPLMFMFWGIGLGLTWRRYQ